MPPPFPGRDGNGNGDMGNFRRIRRSKILWDEARAPNAPRSAMMRAILYELQPIRFSTMNVGGFISYWRDVFRSAYSIGWELIEAFLPIISHAVKSARWKHVPVALGVIAYCLLLAGVHRLLEAGPMMLIVTALIAIFTVGLGDDEGGGMSAYSVFNRGFRTILGTVNADDLVAEQVGGVMFAQAQAANRAAGHPEEEEENNNEQQQQQQQRRLMPNDNNNNNNNNGQGPGPRRRRTGKKARRRNLEARREIQRQRQAAMDMGFAGGGRDEAVAMNRLLEEQIIAMGDQNHQRNNGNGNDMDDDDEIIIENENEDEDEWEQWEEHDHLIH